MTFPMKYLIQCLMSIAVCTITGCTIFSTRDPEDPTSARSSFIPPTSAQLVIGNLKNAILEKNTENYIQCLSDTTKGATTPFVFEPSLSVSALYPSLFLQWNVGKERQAFQSLMNTSASDATPALLFINDRYDVTTPDSTVFQAEYVLTVPHRVQTIPTQVRGYIRLTVAPQTSGLWSIVRWADSSPTQSDTVNSTWSLFKAQFSN